MGKVYIGTSGWIYKGWEKTFYPEDISGKEHLEFYTTQFPSVEINATFYRLPTLKMVKGWRDRVPDGFVFAVKGSRYITHLKKLVELGGGLNKFFRRIEPMKARIGPVLWQLPPFLKKSPRRLAKFLRQLPRDYCHAVEFRHPSWLEDDVFDILREHKAAFVSVSSLGMPANLTVTADFAYIRFHGLKNGAAHDYSKSELESWAKHIRKQARAGKNVYAYFNNDANVRAPNNARMLMQMIGRPAVIPLVGKSVPKEQLKK
jgi:uncharacterized protein YecE (DUF72 family)